jgi:alpha-glucosidase
MPIPQKFLFFAPAKTKLTMPKRHTPALVHEQEALTGERYPDVYYAYQPDAIVQHYQEKDDIFVYACANGLTLKVEVVRADIFRFRYALEGEFERDFSYALVAHGRPHIPRTILWGDAEHYYIETEKVRCCISKADLQVSMLDAQSEKLICADAAPFYGRRTIHRGVDLVKVTKAVHEGEYYFGLGDKSCRMNLRGLKLENWNTDAFGYQADTDPLYRSIPFYYGLREGRGYGIFLHNTFRTHFDFESGKDGQMAFWAEGGEMDYFFLYGPELMRVAEGYAWLTGTPELPPLWALGFHQCRWSYYPESRVYEVAREFRQRQIPCDAIYLDIDYMDGYRCFTWDEEHFPQPAKLIADLKKDGFQTVVMIDPGIRTDPQYHVYREGLARDAFCRRASGELMRGPVWPPDCVFPDFTSPEVREWWGGLYRQLYLEQGVSGFWNDMNEPAVFKVNSATFPDDARHAIDGQPGDHRRAHNIYGQQMSRASQEGLKKLQPAKRPFILTRASFSGGQRYASAWTGDNVASWEHLRLANLQCQRLSASGFSFVGSDIGGFKEQPDGELLVRWLQLAVFHPLFRIHSMGNNVDGAAEAEAEAIHEAERTSRMDQEPWSFGEEYARLAKEAIELRYELLPYIYTVFQQHCRTGQPAIRSLFFYDQSDAENLFRDYEFLYGPHLLVLPVLEPGLQLMKAYLPRGDWYDYWSGERYAGQQEVELPVVPHRIPLMVRAGAVIPNYPVQQYMGEKRFETITLRAYFGEGSSELYEDAGEGYGYQSEGYRRRHFQLQPMEGKLQLSQKQEGGFAVGYRHFRLLLFGLPFAPAYCRADGQALEWKLEAGCLEVMLPEGFGVLEVA